MYMIYIYMMYVYDIFIFICIHVCVYMYTYTFINTLELLIFVLKYNFLPKHGNETERALFIYINEKCTHCQKC